jgi:hypothetical protein
MSPPDRITEFSESGHPNEDRPRPPNVSSSLESTVTMPKKSEVFIGHIHKVGAIPVHFLRLDLPILVNRHPS